MNDNHTIIYRINNRDEIIYINEEWDKFAILNDASNLFHAKFLNRSLWDFIDDFTIKSLYRKIMDKVRAGSNVKFNIFCNYGDYRRLFELHISLQQNGEVQFESKVLKTELRPAISNVENDDSRADELLIVCSWCNRVNVESENWQEIEEAIINLRLFEFENLPQLSHGICNDCYLIMSEKFDEES